MLARPWLDTTDLNTVRWKCVRAKSLKPDPTISIFNSTFVEPSSLKSLMTSRAETESTERDDLGRLRGRRQTKTRGRVSFPLFNAWQARLRTAHKTADTSPATLPFLFLKSLPHIFTQSSTSSEDESQVEKEESPKTQAKEAQDESQIVSTEDWCS